MTRAEIEGVAKGLSAAEKDAVCGRYSFTSPMDQEEGELALVERGIWNELYGVHSSDRLTERGIAVRDFLREGGDGTS